MDNQTLWGLITLVFVVVPSCRMFYRFFKNNDFPLDWIDWTCAVSFVVLMICWSQDFFPIPSTVLAVLAGCAFAVARLTFVNRNHFPQHARVAIAATIAWIVALQLWGFIWRWDRHFDGPEFFALNIALPLLSLVVLIGYRWVKKT